MSTSLDRSRLIPAPRDRVWEVLARFDRLSDWAPDADHSAPLTLPASGPGAARRVQGGRTVLVETIVTWEPPCRLGYRIEGLPARAGTITDEWRLEERGSQTLATITTTVDAAVRPPGPLVERIVARRLARVSDGLLDGLAQYLTRGAAA